MIARLKGLLDETGDGWVILDVGGVGYLISCSSKTLNALPGIGEAVTLEIETQVREDAISLFGFADLETKDLFKLLTSVQGVGAKVALAIHSVLSADQFRNAVIAADKAAISAANGVGPKLALRIITELKDKVGAGLSLGPAALSASKPSGAKAGAGGANNEQDVADAVSALVNLGYKAMEAHSAVVRVRGEMGDSATVARLVPAALKELGRL